MTRLTPRRRPEWERLAFTTDPPRMTRRPSVMTEQEFCDALAHAITADHLHSDHHTFAAAPLVEGVGFRERLSQAFAALRRAGLSWPTILAALAQILPLILGGGSWQAILAAIFALFNKPAPTPA